jgi:hypothetical protein
LRFYFLFLTTMISPRAQAELTTTSALPSPLGVNYFADM